MRYIWHINGILAAVLLTVLYFGLQGIPEALRIHGDNSRTSSNDTNGQNSSLNDEGNSAMIEAAVTFTRRFGPPTGMVIISIDPPEAVAKGAEWKIDTSQFLKSGQKASTVAAGDHVIGLKKIEGYTAPKPFKITVGRLQTVKKTVKYTLIPPPEYGAISVTLGPEGIAEKGGKWKVDNGPWHQSGETVEKILVGNRKITFAGVTDYDPPATLRVNVEKDQTSNQSADYTLIDYGSVLVNLLPDDSVKAGVKWRVKGSPTWHDSGKTDNKVRVGKQTIEFQGHKQWKAPAAMAIEVEKDKLFTTEASFEWVPLKQGSLIVKISPEDSSLKSPKWQINGKGPWYDSDKKVEEIDEGKYSINFSKAAGWIIPETKSVQILTDHVSVLEAEYRKPKPAGPTFTLTGTIVLPPRKSRVWVKLPNAKRDHVFFMGEMIDTHYKLVSVSHGKAIVNREGYDFTLTIPTPSPSKPPVTANPKTASSKSKTVRPGTSTDRRTPGAIPPRPPRGATKPLPKPKYSKPVPPKK